MSRENNLNDQDLVYRLRKRAEIRRQIQSRKSVQEGKPDRIAELLEEAAAEIEKLHGTMTLTIPIISQQPVGEKLVSRSQAKSLILGFEDFKTVILDFTGVEEIGQAFSDEVFRVFHNAHKDTKLVPINMTPAVRDMVSRANIMR